MLSLQAHLARDWFPRLRDAMGVVQWYWDAGAPNLDPEKSAAQHRSLGVILLILSARILLQRLP